MLKKWFGILVVLTLLSQFLPVGLFQADNAQAQGPAPASKISSLLAIQVRTKLAAVGTVGAVANLKAQNQAVPYSLAQLADTGLGNPGKQQVFIHFAQKPTDFQIGELLADNITAYPDSWIPPVGEHSTGFILADIPLEKLETLAGKGYVVSLETAETLLEPQNDLGTQMMNADDVWASGYNGAGVRIAVLDSGLDLTHPDFPTPVAKRDYSAYPVFDDNIANTVTGHGTHVAGSALGRGTQSGGKYKGSAPGADLIFLKIGSDSTGSASTAAEINAIRDAVDIYNADVITMSYGGWSQYHDGTGESAQAVDYAVSRGAVVLISAGNEANDGQHYSGTVPAGSTTGFIPINVTNAVGNDTTLWFNMVWYDGLGTSNILSTQLYDPALNPLTTFNGTQSQSTRGTEARMGWYGTSTTHYAVPAGSSTPYVKVANNSGTSQFFHLYVYTGSKVTFQNADPNYTLSSPAEADGAIAVGAHVSRPSWTSYKGISGWNFGETIDTIATFSSRGPRVDTGAQGKPNIVAPGSAIISARDNTVYPIIGSPVPSYDPAIIDNDGLNQNGSGPADYFAMQGTSMATPIAAGVAALIIQKNPGITPAQVKNALQSTAVDKGTAGWDGVYGYGLVNALAAVSQPLTVTTVAADNITANLARLKGSLNSLGSFSSANVSFEYGTTSGNLTQLTPLQLVGSTGAFSANITGLTPATTYYFRAKAAGDGVAFGNQLSFATQSVPPSVTTNAADNIALTSARLNGNLNALGTSSSANVSFEYGTTSGSLTLFTTPENLNGTGNFDTDITGLTPGITYYFRAKAVGAGTAYGNQLTFNTQTVPPSVTTNAADNITFSAANLRGNLTSLGTASSANVSFEYGTVSGNLTQQTPSQMMITPGTFSANVSGLSGSATYYFRAKAVGAGAAYGSELSFTTLAPPPVSISVSPPNPALLSGRTQQFSANGTYADSSTANITGAVVWTSSNTSVAVVNSSGLATALAAGTARITATLGAVSANTTLNVSASVEVNSGNNINLVTNETRGNIPLTIKGIPNNGSGNGIGAFTFSLNWNKDVVHVTNVTAASVEGFSIFAGTANNTNGTVTVTGFSTGAYLTGNVTVAYFNVTAVGTSGNSTLINVTVNTLGDQVPNPVSATPVNATARIVNLVAETSLGQSVGGGDGLVSFELKINRIKNPADGSTAIIPGGISSYSATASATPGSGIQFLGVYGVAPFNGPSYNATSGVFSVPVVGSPIQPDNSKLAYVIPILTGNAATSGNLTITINSIGAAAQPELNVPEEQSNTITLRRGNAKDDGVVDIFDALYIAQYIVGQRSINSVSALNAASVKHDGAGGDKIDIFDALFIAQYIVGQKNASFQ